MALSKTEDGAKSYVQRAMELMTRVSTNASLTALLNGAYKRYIQGGGTPPPHYLWVTDITNPVAGYHSRKNPVENPPELAEVFALGNALHRQARYWFPALPGFTLYEGKVDGGYVGLSGITGYVDFLLNKSVLEFKTKQRAPQTPEQVIELYPQDVEQLLFYAILLPGAADENFLAFLDRSDSSFTAYRVELLDRGLILNLTRQRMAELRRALREDDPSRLGRCRYFKSGCKFLAAGVCSCQDFDEIDMSTLFRAIGTTRDKELERAMEQAREESKAFWDEIAWWDLISPRRRLLRLQGRDPPYDPGKRKKAAKEVLYECIRMVQEIQPDLAVKEEARSAAWDCGVKCPTKSILVKSAKRPGGAELRSYVAQAPMGGIRSPRDLFPFYIAELAIRCAIVGCPRGVVFLIYPDEDNKIIAYEVYFSSIEDLRALVRKQVKAIQKAEDQGNPGLVHECERFMRNGCNEYCLCQ